MCRQLTIKSTQNCQLIVEGHDDFSTDELRIISTILSQAAFSNSMQISNFLNFEIDDSKLFKGVKNNHYVK